MAGRTLRNGYGEAHRKKRLRLAKVVDAATDSITTLQVIAGVDGTSTVVAGILRGERISQYIIRRLSAFALSAFERDLETSVRRGEDPELVLAAWSAVEGEE